MTKIDRIGLPSDLKRRNFLIGSGAAGLAFGYVAVSGVQGVSDALAAGKFEPTAWYSIAPDGKITVMVGKAEMGQHVSSAMAQIVARPGHGPAVPDLRSPRLQPAAIPPTIVGLDRGRGHELEGLGRDHSLPAIQEHPQEGCEIVHRPRL